MELFFGSLFAVLTTALVGAMIVFIVLAARNRERIEKWGRLIALFVVLGTVVSAFSATRDRFGFEGALFSMQGTPDLVFSVIGGAIYVAAFVSVFFKNQNYKRRCFYMMAGLFLANVVAVETCRIALV